MTIRLAWTILVFAILIAFTVTQTWNLWIVRDGYFHRFGEPRRYILIPEMVLGAVCSAAGIIYMFTHIRRLK